jgi:beta-galactosidase
LGYLAGIWPPGFLAHGEDAKKALHNQIVAHVKAYDLITTIDNIDSDGDGITKKVGFAHAMHKSDFLPFHFLPGFVILHYGASNRYDYFINDYFLNAVVKGEEDLNYLNNGKIQDKTSSNFIVHQDWKNKLDFLGINYYRKVHVFHSPFPDLVGLGFQGGIFDNDLTKTNYRFGLLNDLGWEIYPRGLYDLMIKVKQKWNKPILITENGIPLNNDDLLRPQYIISHVNEIVNAINDGVDVLGYMYWSFHDNWELHENYNPEGKFGLFTINREGREILSETKVHHPSFLEGSAGDDIINQGVHTPGSQCTVDNVILILQDKKGNILATTSKGQPDAIAPFPYVSKFGASNR